MTKDFLSPTKNNLFSSLRGYDLQELIITTENYILDFRLSLNLPPNLRFGVELEYEGLLKEFADKFIAQNLSNWNSKRDWSLNFGGEITSPIMTDKEKCWQELKIICDYLNEKHADTMHKAGGHIHIGACILGRDTISWRLFLKLYTAYEPILFRFAYGDKTSGRKKLIKYAHPIADIFHANLSCFNTARDLYTIINAVHQKTRYFALNLDNVCLSNPELQEVKNTIEFRLPNGTTDAVIWQNNINAFAKMLISCKTKVINEDFLDYKLHHEFQSYKDNAYLYNTISLKNVLEFVNLVFDNNLDKVYFLRQCLKDFKENYSLKSPVRVKTLSK